jgi:hypothetical protein
VDTADILEMKRNFDNKVRGIDIAVDENHDPDHRALGRYKELYTKNKDTELRAKIELTELGADILSKGSYKYFSPEICWIWYDEER